MSALQVEQFEPVYLELGECRLTEYGKRYFEERLTFIDRFDAVLRDIAKLARAEQWKWPLITRQLELEGVPVAVSGLSQYVGHLVMDHLVGKTAFTMPATIAMALDTAAPTSTSTGASQAETAYTGYTARQAIAGAAWTAATTATPSVSANNATITFGNCTGTGATLLGFTIDDSVTVGAGNAIWFGALTSTVISTTQTPPTVAAAALSLSVNTT
jgi:hypothetical protein